MHTPHATHTDCPDCNDGLVDCSSDHLNHRGEHYTRDWTEACERCDGTGRLELDADDAAQATLTRTLLAVTARIAADARRSAKHVDVALDYDAMLFVGAATEAPAVSA